jgi:predicted HAD superfamily Cof-like phosphohydrolase
MSINYEYNEVKKFHEAFGHPVAEKPTVMDLERAKKRYSWLLEEINEFLDATNKADLYEQVDAMIDVIYFALGTLVEIGVPPAEIFTIVQKANMSKLWNDGKPHYKPDGKIMKPETWEDPHDKIVKQIDSYIK